MLKNFSIIYIIFAVSTTFCQDLDDIIKSIFKPQPTVAAPELIDNNSLPPGVPEVDVS